MSEEQVEQAQDTAPSNPEMTPQELEKIEEAKLKAKFPSAMPGGPGRMGGHSSFLQKRLAKGRGQKFFDSGDYQMAKQKMGGINKAPQKVLGPAYPTGDAIPTPETVPARKTSIVKSKLTNVSVAPLAPANVGSNVS